jgi:hypothetical protein
MDGEKRSDIPELLQEPSEVQSHAQGPKVSPSQSGCRFLAKFRNIEASNFVLPVHKVGLEALFPKVLEQFRNVRLYAIFGSSAMVRTGQTFRNSYKNCRKYNLIPDCSLFLALRNIEA